jgi:putative protease
VLHLADRVYLPFTDLAENRVRLKRRPKELMAWLLPVTNGQLDERIRQNAGRLRDIGLDGVLAGNAAHIELLRDCGLPLYGDATLNAFNGWTLGAYKELGLKGVALSHEMTMAQIAALPGCGIEKEAAVYGRLPLMHSAHCPVGAEIARSANGKPCGLCLKNKSYELIDRIDARFPLLCDTVDCRCAILNSDILFVPQLAARLAAAGVSLLRLYAFDEPPEEIERLLAVYRKALQGFPPDKPLELGFTKGHYFRGV